MRLCVICKQAIEEDRLDAISDTRLCTQHGREIEKFGGEFKLSAEQERTSKKSSLKVNYGGITTFRKRNHDAIDDLRDEWELKQFETE